MTIKETFEAWGQSVSKFFKDLVSFISNPIYNAATGIITWTAGMTEQVNKFFGDVMGHSMITTVEKMETGEGEIIDPVLDAVGNAVLMPMKLGLKAAPVMQNVINKLTESMVKGVADFVMPPEGEVSEAEAWAGAGRFVALIEELQVASHVIGIVAEAGTFGQLEGVQKMFDSLYYNLGFCWLTWTIFGAPLRAGIADPLERSYRAKYRTAEPPRSEYEEAFRRGMTDAETLKGQYRRLGYPEGDIPLLMGTVLKRLSYGTVISALKVGLVTESDAITRIRNLGYSVEDAALLVQLKTMEDVDEEKGVIKSEATSAFKKGIITELQYRSYLTDLGYSPDRIDLLVSLNKAVVKSTIRDLQSGSLATAFREGILTETEFNTRLLDIGYTTDGARIIIDTEKAKMQPALRKPTLSQFGFAFREAIITETDFRDALVDLGYGSADIDMFVAAEKAKIPEGVTAKVPKLTRSVLLKAYESGVITESELRGRLGNLGFVPADIDIIVETKKREMTEKAMVVPKLPTAGSLTIAFREGVLTESDFRTWLTKLDYDTVTIDLMVKTELAKMVVSAKPLTVGALSRSYREGVIIEETFKQRLTDLGISEQDINLIVETEKSRIAPAIKRLSLAQTLKAYKENWIDINECYARVAAMGYPADDIMILMSMSTPEVIE